MTTRHTTTALSALCATMILGACGPTEEEGGELEVPSTYAFDSQFADGESSVSYSGQVFRHVLIEELDDYIGGLTDQLSGGTFTPTDDQDVMAAFDFYLRFDSASSGQEPLTISTTPGIEQSVFDDISSDKDIIGKLAGNDTATDHVDWSTDFAGWSSEGIAAHGGSITSPTGLVTAFLETLEEQAIARANGDTLTGPTGAVIEPVYVTAKGQDLKQLTQKFLVVGVAFHQAADDYLDDDVEGKGLLASNARDGDNAYSILEHQWDEGFGYFGASRDYTARTDAEIADSPAFDTDGDGAIDLETEYDFGHSANAAKRDAGSAEATDYSAQAFEGFVTGRAIITRAAGEGRELTDAELADLKIQRDAALGAWERALASTAVHYVNDTLGDMDTFGTDAYSFTDHAKHWSELKGFALGLQFNPRSPLTKAQFAQLHGLIGDAPTLPDATAPEIEAYRADLEAARALLGESYGFAAANLEGW